LLAVPVTHSFFDTLGAKASLGRTFRTADESLACTVVLADGFWKTGLGAPGDIVGRNLTLNEVPCRVAGVMPARFNFYPRQTQMWILAGPNFRPRREEWCIDTAGHSRVPEFGIRMALGASARDLVLSVAAYAGARFSSA
jgi:hypothetical protein